MHLYHWKCEYLERDYFQDTDGDIFVLAPSVEEARAKAILRAKDERTWRGERHTEYVIDTVMAEPDSIDVAFVFASQHYPEE